MVMKFKVTDFTEDPLSEHRIEITSEEVDLFCCCCSIYFLLHLDLWKNSTQLERKAQKIQPKVYL